MKLWFISQQTLNEKSHIRIIKNLTCLIPVHSSCPFSAWTEKIIPERYKIWPEQKKKILSSAQLSWAERPRFSISPMPTLIGWTVNLSPLIEPILSLLTKRFFSCTIVSLPSSMGFTIVQLHYYPVTLWSSCTIILLHYYPCTLLSSCTIFH